MDVRSSLCVSIPAASCEGASGQKVTVEALESRVHLSTTPNDPSFSKEWGMNQISAPSAWSSNTGKVAVIVGHIDTGIEYTHPDLYENIWLNQAEIPSAVKSTLHDTDHDGKLTFWDLNASGNAGKVADGNHNGRIDAGDVLRPVSQGGWEDGINGKNNSKDTYVDDIIGWDFGDNDNDPIDHDGHGTHTAGVIGAMGNNGRGVAGVAWKCRLMSVKVFPDNSRDGSLERIAKAIRYVVDNGARVSNNSYGAYYGAKGDVLYQAIDYARQHNHLVVCAAGNDGVNDDTAENRSFPASYDLPNIVAVGATDQSGNRASFSNYGSANVELAAPGKDIYSTWTGGGYRYASGTSMAAPHVTGIVALMLSKNGSVDYSALRSTLISSSKKTSSVQTLSVSHGIVNASKALSLITA